MRQYVEASQQRDLLKLSLAEDYSRLLVDSHLLWGLAEDEWRGWKRVNVDEMQYN